MKRNNVTILLLIPLVLITSLDLQNKLNIGPKDRDGFTPLNHGVFGTTIKLLVCLATLFCLYSVIRRFIRKTPLVIGFTLIAAMLIFIIGSFIVAFTSWTF